MATIRVLRTLAPEDRAAVEAFLAAQDAAGARLPDHLRLDLRHGPRPGFIGAVALSAANTSHERMLGYAQASSDQGGVVVDAIVDADADETAANALRRHLLAGVIDALPPWTSVTWWTGVAGAAAIAEELGLRPGRALHQMRRPLPVTQTTEVTTRSFVVGRDEEAWLTVNNAAFEWHPEQGGWDLAMLQQREREPWFDPEGFRLHERHDELAAFCWTKVHPGTPAVGEIYVIGVHPRFQGMGLGGSMTIAGLTSLYERGVTIGMLYVDADNIAAVGLYQQLEFEVVHTDRAFVSVTPGAPE